MLVEILDLTRTNDITIDNAKHIVSTAYTMGFWFFSNAPSTGGLGTSIFKVRYTDNMMITVSNDSNDLFSHCFIGLEYYDIDSKTNNAANLKAFYTGTDDSGSINMAKSAALLSKSKWQHIRCAYSYDNMKYYLEVNKDGYPGSALAPVNLKMPSYFKNKQLNMPLRKQVITNPQLFISGLSSITDQSVFIRNLVFFADYIHPEIYFHY